MSDKKFTPCIILPGIGQSKVEMVDKKGEKIKMAWPLDIDGEELLGKLKGPMMKMMLFRKDAGFSDKVASVLEEAADPLKINPDGTFKNNLRVVKYPNSLAGCTADEKRYIYKMVPLQKLSEVIGEENLYFFSYNSFGDTYEIASELSEFIDKIKAERGCDKVNLVPVSLGGALSTAYFKHFAYKKDIKRVMYMVAALGGSRLISDVLEKNIYLENGLEIVELLGGAKAKESFAPILNMMPAGVFEATVEKVIDTLIKCVLGNSLSMWGIIPPERYEILAQKYIYDKAHSELRKKADDFYLYRKDFLNTIDKLQDDGVEFFAVCAYGLELLPLVHSKNMSSDGIIQSESTSLGALFAPIGETLTQTCVRERNCNDSSHSHISPDGTLDASYGKLPERTWYFYKQGHDAIAYNDKALEVASRVLWDDDFTDIYSDPALPQFMTAQDNRK